MRFVFNYLVHFYCRVPLNPKKIRGKVYMKKIAFIILIVCNLSNPCWSQPPESSKPIKIILSNWTSQVVLSKIIGKIYLKMGYKIEYQTVSIDKQWGLLHRGLADVQVEVWEGTMTVMFEKMIQKGGVVCAGDHDAKTREEWWYPAYLEKVCPGLPDWKALKRCYKLFITPKTAPKGMYLGGPWEKPDMARIRALNMNFEIVRAKNGDELWRKLDKAIKEQTPIVIFNWSPNWVEAKYDGKFVEFPDYDPACEVNPKWGMNPDLPYDCGNPKDGWLKKAASSVMETQWPCAFNTFKSFNFSNQMIAELALWVDINKMSYDAAAEKWLEKNASTWKSWIPDKCQ